MKWLFKLYLRKVLQDYKKFWVSEYEGKDYAKRPELPNLLEWLEK